ncbi:MAG: VWA domain-containing protein [Anaerolineales bacterium]|nr:MAG: VWA domain-containing protein [Anaerolineales bacterium]
MPNPNAVPDHLKKESTILYNLLLFGRLLRELGMDVNPGRMMDLIHALEFINIGIRTDFYHASRGLLVHNKGDIPLFDQAFDLFWQKPMEEWFTINLETLIHKKKPRPLIAPPPLNLPEEPPPSEQQQGSDDLQTLLEVTVTYSQREKLRQKDFSELTGEELEAVKKLMENLSLQLGDRLSRRRRPGKRERLDLRRSMRKSFKHGGEILHWARLDRKTKPRPIVVIADISGSMERYTRLLLHFIYGLAQDRLHPVEAFVFSTRLTRITRQLNNREIETALRQVSKTVHDWAGGTRIGESLKTFNFDWGRRVLGRGAVVMVISDGWDRGDIDLLAMEMDRLQRSCYRTIWLNPLLGAPEYEPLTRGIQAALPYVDDFLPVHNLASLEDLAQHLESIGGRKSF